MYAIIFLSRLRCSIADKLRFIVISSVTKVVCSAAEGLLFDRYERVLNVLPLFVCFFVYVCAHCVYVSIRQRERRNGEEKERKRLINN